MVLFDTDTIAALPRTLLNATKDVKMARGSQIKIIINTEAPT